MSILSPILPYVAGESLTSYVSNLARLHSIPSAREFASNMGLRIRGVVSGCTAEIAEVASITRVPYEELFPHVLRFEQGGARSLGSERLVKSLVRRLTVHVCPSCLLEDIEGSAYRPDCSARGRTIWMLTPVTTCPKHDLELVEAARVEDVSKQHDFANVIASRIPDLTEMSRTAQKRRPNLLQSYLLGRFNGAKPALPWLDGLHWHAAARACTMLGLMSEFGKKASTTDLSPRDSEQASDAGFGIARGGEPAIVDFLDGLVAVHNHVRKRGDRSVGAYGQLQRWLKTRGTACDGDLDPFRRLLLGHAIKSLPVGPGDLLFGLSVPERKLHTIATACREAGSYHRRMKHLLVDAGLVAPDASGKVDPCSVFDAEAARPILARAADEIPRRELGPYLGASKRQVNQILLAGLLRPTGDPSVMRARFARADVDSLLARIMAGSDGGEDAMDLVDLKHVTSRTSFGFVEVLHLILNKKLARVTRLPGKCGLAAILIDLQELALHISRPERLGLRTHELPRFLDVIPIVAGRLTTCGIIPAERLPNPRTPYQVRYVSVAAAEKFRQTYLTSGQIARSKGTQGSCVIRQLKSRGVKPAFDPSIVRAHIYRRCDVE